METVTEADRAAAKRPIWWGPLALSAASLCWGLSVPLSKKAVATLPPFTLLALQLLVSVIALWIIILLRAIASRQGRSGITRRDFWHACLSGALQPGLTYLLVTLGLLFTTASNVVLLDASEPIMIMALAALFLRERISRLQAPFAILAAIGVVFVIWPQLGGAAVSDAGLFGDLLVLAGIALASIYVVLSRRLIVVNDGLILAAIQQSAALCIVVAALVISLAAGLWPSGLAAMTGDLSFIVVLSGLLQFALPFGLYLTALRHISAAVSALYLPLIPVSGLIAAYLILEERLVVGQWIGAILIVTSVLGISWLTSRQR